MSEPGQFCGACGNRVPPTVAFCTSCGQPVVRSGAPSAAPSTPPPPYQQAAAPVPTPGIEYLAPASQPSGGRRTVAVVAALVVLVAVGGVVAGVKLLGGGDGELVGGGQLPNAVRSEPDEAWTYDTDEYASVTTSGDTTIVSLSDSGKIVALDSDGKETWSTFEDSGYGYGYVEPDNADIVVVQGYEDYGIGVLSMEDGDELWFDDDGGGSLGVTDEGIFVSTYDEDGGDSELALRDPKSGDEKWSLDGVYTAEIRDDAVYAIVDGELRRLNPSSGDEEWSADLDLAEDEYPSLAVADDLVAVSTDDEVIAYSPDGDTLWSESPGDADSSVSVGVYSPDRVYVDQTDYSDDVTSEQVTVYDKDGEVGDLDVDEDVSFYGQAFTSGGSSYLLNYGDGALYEEKLDRVASYDGCLVTADSGLYRLDNGRLGFYEYGKTAESWELDVNGDEGSSVYAGDGVVFTLINGTITAYR